jgi:hypothetical protein
MLFPLTETVAEVLPALPPQLLDHRARRRLEQVAAHLPAALTERMHFECRLGASGRVDLLVRVDRCGAGQVQATWGASIFASDSWAGISGLCRRWQLDAQLAEAVSALWFEFDLKLDQLEGEFPTPRLFIQLRSQWRGTASETAILFAAVFSLLGLPPPGRVLSAALAALPRSSRLLAIGCDPASVAVLPRLCSWHPARAELREFLDRLRDDGEGARTEQTLADLACPDVPLVSHLDGREVLAPGLGVELTFQRKAQLRGRLVEQPFLERLVATGLCPGEKADALVRWPGVSRARLCHQLWPLLLVRRINHLKLWIDEGAVVEAKAYLSLHQRLHRGLL